MTLSRRRAASCPGRMAGVDGEPVGTDREFHDAAICLDHAGSSGREAHQ